MIQWHPSVTFLLEQENYTELVNSYEKIVENNPEEINNYWYLGLSYLLSGREEEAQTTWFMPFLELTENETELAQKELLMTLEQEAQRQTKAEKYQLAWLIRQEIKQLKQDDINNLLSLLNLNIQLNQFRGGDINDWDLINLIKSAKKENLDFELTLEVLSRLIEYPLLETVEMAEAILINQEGNSEIIELIIGRANYMGYYQRYYHYSIDLVSLCLKYEPNNIRFLKDIYWFYLYMKDYHKCKELAQEFIKYSVTIPQKIFGFYFLLSSTISDGDWLDVKEMVANYESLLAQLSDNPSEITEYFIRDSLIIVGQILLYVKDEPRKKRPLINSLANLFQRISQSDICCAVQFPINPLLKQPRKLKIGYIGHTLKTHSVGFLSRWLINHHNRQDFAIYLYMINQPEDEITQKWFRDKVDQAINLKTDVKSIITQIEKDEIDILVDLDSFTFNVTAMVMSLKPAPIQVSWLGMDATGIPAIDYFIADPYVLPNDADEYYQEKIWRLPHTYLGIDGFEIDVPNLKREDLGIPENAVIYFNMQNALKRHPDMIHQQMKIIKAVSNSYLLIKGTGDREIMQKLFMTIAEEEGVDTNRLILLDRSITEAVHRADLNIADIVLDTFPYNGATTTLECLWMEIPVVTRVGEQFAARNTYTFMMNAGITEGIAWNDEEYVEWGIKLGTDANLRKEISWKLRQSKQTSPLWNGKQFAQEMEKAYQEMWNIYVAKNQ